MSTLTGRRYFEDRWRDRALIRLREVDLAMTAPDGSPVIYAETGELNVGVWWFRLPLPPVPAKAAHRRRYGR